MSRNAPEHSGGIADEADLGLAQPIHLGRIDVDLDDGELVVDAPGRNRQLQARADREHDIGVAPEPMPADEHVAERMTLIEHGLAANCTIRLTSAFAASTSGGSSIPTGRGRPDCSSWKALPTRAGAAWGLITRPAHLESVRRMPIWFGISCSRPWPLSIARLGICPISASTFAPVE